MIFNQVANYPSLHSHFLLLNSLLPGNLSLNCLALGKAFAFWSYLSSYQWPIKRDFLSSRNLSWWHPRETFSKISFFLSAFMLGEILLLWIMRLFAEVLFTSAFVLSACLLRLESPWRCCSWLICVLFLIWTCVYLSGHF